MKIGIENIESLIFDYHEGNLSDSERAEVLNYIHNHPEYETDFTQWAQSYLHTDNKIAEYGLTDRLLQIPVAVWYNKPWIKIASCSLIVLFGLYYYTTKDPVAIEIHVNSLKTETAKEPDTAASIETAAPLLQTNQVHKHNDSKNDHQEKKSALLSIYQRTDSTGFAIESYQADKNTDTNNARINMLTNNLSDSTATDIYMQPAVKGTKKEVNKKRRSYKIKPADKFIPTNRDF